MSPGNGPRADGVPAFVLRLLADVDGRSPVPLYEQIASRLKGAVAGELLAAGDPLPSVRQLAAELRINPATVVQAYRHLEAEGFAAMRQGSGSFVRLPSADQRKRQREAQARKLVRRILGDAARLGVPVADLSRAWSEILEESNQ